MGDRRSTDLEDADFRDRREHERVILRPMNGHTKWVVAFVSTAIVVMLGALVRLDRAQVVQTSEAALAKATTNDKRIEVLATDVKGQLATLRDDVKEIKDLLKGERR